MHLYAEKVLESDLGQLTFCMNVFHHLQVMCIL